jgi:hypothetical protein
MMVGIRSKWRREFNGKSKKSESIRC